jgi:hypothetical protein
MKMTIFQNENLTKKWQIYKNSKLMKWQVGETAS